MNEKQLVGIAEVMIKGDNQPTKVTIYVNREGNLELDGIGSVDYELLNNELSLVRVSK